MCDRKVGLEQTAIHPDDIELLGLGRRHETFSKQIHILNIGIKIKTKKWNLSIISNGVLENCIHFSSAGLV